MYLIIIIIRENPINFPELRNIGEKKIFLFNRKTPMYKYIFSCTFNRIFKLPFNNKHYEV